MRNGLLLAVTLGGLSLVAQAQDEPVPPAKDPNCDRACLEGYMDRYLEAMLNRDVSDDLFARNVRFTENGIELPLGAEGLWYGMSGLDGYRFYVPDLETQQVAMLGSVIENMSNGGINNGEGNDVGLSVRLKIRDGLITEVEQLVSRPEVQLGGGGGDEGGGGMFGNVGTNVRNMGTPHPVFLEALPESQRHTREELVAAGNNYFTALARHDSQGYYPFSEDCERYENGIRASADCLEEFTSDRLNGIVDRIRDRRFVAADTERSIIFSFAFFDHYRINWTWQLAELFKIDADGNIQRIEAIFHQAPFGISSGWSSFEDSISEEIQSIR